MLAALLLLPLAFAAHPPVMDGVYGQAGARGHLMARQLMKEASPSHQVRVAATRPPCPSGCCEAADWICCGDDKSCAQTASDCPTTSLAGGLGSPSSRSRPANLEPCPSGCCPFAGWFCCGEGMGDSGVCAADPADCP